MISSEKKNTARKATTSRKKNTARKATTTRKKKTAPASKAKTGSRKGPATGKSASSRVGATRKKAAVARKGASTARKKPRLVSVQERRDLIAEAAYYRALERGFQGGDSTEDWLVAEAEIDAMLVRDGLRTE